MAECKRRRTMNSHRRMAGHVRTPNGDGGGSEAGAGAGGVGENLEGKGCGSSKPPVDLSESSPPRARSCGTPINLSDSPPRRSRLFETPINLSDSPSLRFATPINLSDSPPPRHRSFGTPINLSESSPPRPRSFGAPIHPNRATAGPNEDAFPSARKRGAPHAPRKPPRGAPRGTPVSGEAPSQEGSESGTSRRRQGVKDKKESADRAYASQSYELALKLYTEAIGMADREDAETKARLLANRAATLMNLGRSWEAIRDCEEALQLKPDYLKVVLRKARAHARLKEWDLAFKCFKVCRDDAAASPKPRQEASMELAECRDRYVQQEEQKIRAREAELKAREERRRAAAEEKERKAEQQQRAAAAEKEREAEQERKRKRDLDEEFRRLAEELRRQTEAFAAEQARKQAEAQAHYEQQQEQERRRQRAHYESQGGWGGAPGYAGGSVPEGGSSNSRSHGPPKPPTPKIFSGGYYATLGITSFASTAEVKKAYHKLALQHHPDKNKGDPASAERFKAISGAYEVLVDEGERAAYNASLSRS